VVAGQGGDVDAGGNEGEIKTACEGGDEAGIGGAGAAAEGVVEVEDGELAGAFLDEGVEEGGGIDAAGNGYEEAAREGNSTEGK